MIVIYDIEAESYPYVLYLDQNFVSNIVKARLGVKGYDVFLELFLTLRNYWIESVHQ